MIIFLLGSRFYSIQLVLYHLIRGIFCIFMSNHLIHTFLRMLGLFLIFNFLTFFFTTSYKVKVEDIVQSAGSNFLWRYFYSLRPAWKVELVMLEEWEASNSLKSWRRVKCHVGYVPSGQRVVGLSKLSWVADVFARRFEDPSLTDDVCSALHYRKMPIGLAGLRCSHFHFTNFAFYM